MKQIFFLTLTIILISACNQKKESGTLSAELSNIPDGTVLSLIDLDNDQLFQTLSVTNGKFETSFTLSEPRLFGIWGENPKYPKDRLRIWLENSEIRMKGNFEYLINSKVEGSEANKIFLKLDSISQKYNNQYTYLRSLQGRTTNQRILDSISVASVEILNSYRQAKIEFYKNEINSEVALYYLARQTVESDLMYYLINVLSKNDIQMLYQILPDKFKNTKKGEILKEYISLPDIPKVGERFIDVTQYTPDSNTTSIAENLGKYTILDFWASNCGPCRMKHPVMRNLYQKYHNEGLNIIGISSDDNKDAWINAIQADSIPWINLSDLRGSNNKAFMIYGVKAIPRLFLLDENGIILDDNLASKPLEVELEKYFK